MQALGGQSDVFANLLKSDTPDWGKALKMAMPSAVIVGIEALRQAGWTTQIPQRPAVAVRRLRSGNLFYHVEPFEVAQRGTAWFTVSKPGYSPEPRSVPILRPAWALADLLREQDWGQFGLWPDDIEWERVSEEDRSDFEAACKAYAEAGKVSSRAGIQSGNLLLP
ncbi:MAG: hypothetical protein LBS89_06115 [Zoogloeaceae bacterium]|nr:hypothetical protein [Zoogloeaceae bacterium]